MVDALVYVHADLQSHNILVKDGRLSGIIDRFRAGCRVIASLATACNAPFLPDNITNAPTSWDWVELLKQLLKLVCFLPFFFFVFSPVWTPSLRNPARPRKP